MKGTISFPWISFWERSNQMGELASALFTFSAVVLAITWFLRLIKRRKNGSPPLPPGPRGLPLIGNLPFLQPPLHRYFAKLAESYGPIIKLQLGNKLCIVLSSPSTAKEVLRDQDITFANRDVPALGLVTSYGGMDMGWAPYGPQWRMLRKVFVGEIMSNRCLNACSGLRRREVRRMVSNIHTKMRAPINIGELTLETTFNVISSMLWGDTLKGEGEEEERSSTGVEFQQLVAKMNDLVGKPNVSDFFPALAPFDIQGLARRLKKYMLWVNQTLDAIIDRRRREVREGSGGKESQDFLQLLLQIKDRGDPKMPLTTTHIKALFMDIIMAGTETTWVTMEWAMAEMILHSEAMTRAQEEVDQVVGMNNVVEESHLPKLHYLDAIVKEILRLHPAAPLMLPRSPSEPCTLGGYFFPKGASVMVNVWAIQTDPGVWENPLEFRPERFLGDKGKWDYNGNDHRYFPFGSGRRICAGLPMAEKMLMYVLATLLHSFEWHLPERTTLDLEEEDGIALKKAKPLLAIPTTRLSNPELYA